MRMLESRRLTGPSLLLERPGAILDLELHDAERDRALAAWRAAARGLLEAVGWRSESLAIRAFEGGASVAFTAPADALYAASELNEAAWAAAEAELTGGNAPDLAATAVRLREAIAAECRPELLALREAARRRGVLFLHGEDQVSVGSGRGVSVWSEEALPGPDEVDWSRIHDIPIALVTGSNGKTTTVRLLAAIVSAAGRVTGITSTDGISVSGRRLDEGDWSGPMGARFLLRRPEVEVAVLETARGGLLRRGLAVDHADVAVITNVADDHLGEFGVRTLESLAETKLLVARAIGPGGTVVLNADDPVLARAARDLAVPVSWFSLEPGNPVVEQAVAGGGTAAVARDGALLLHEGARDRSLVRIADIPLALGGAARHNVANALAATLSARSLGIPPATIGNALRGFGTDPDDNPGRANSFDIGGARVIVDYAHNPHGMTALAQAIADLPARRRLVLLGQAGDRTDEQIRDLARAAMALRPDRVVAKEMDRYLRGRAPGEVPGLLADEFRRQGLPPDEVVIGGGELQSARKALGWARPEDLLIFALHQDREAVVALLSRLRESGWRAGEPLPRESVTSA